MFRRRRTSNRKKWGIIGGAIAGAAALIPLIPMIKRRGMRVTTLLKKDHHVVNGLITTLQLTPRMNAVVRGTLFDQIRNQVMVHAQAEEEILYPAMRNVVAHEEQWKVDKAYQKHQQIKDILHDLGTMDPTTVAFDTKFAHFKQRIDHHVEEEESEMFAILKQRMSTEQQEQLGRRIHDRKGDLKARRAA